MRNAKVFSGSSHAELASRIVQRLGIPATPLIVTMSPNREVSVELPTSVRSEDCFIIQSGSDSTNDHLLELLTAISCCRTCDARRIIAIIPYFPYSKQCKKKKFSRSTITAKLVANMLAVAGVDHVITLDLHHDQMQGFFSKPVDNLVAEPTLCGYIRDNIPFTDAVAVAKNPGGVKRVTSFSDRLKIDFALIHRNRAIEEPRTATEQQSTEKMVTIEESIDQLCVVRAEWNVDGVQLVGQVQGRLCFLVDDIIDNPQSYISAASLLIESGASKVIIVATHGLLSDNSLEIIEQCPFISKVIVTNSYPISSIKRQQSTKLVVIDISSVFAEAIRRTHNGESISYLFHTAVSANHE